jgi:hypothetical protein
MQKSFSIAYVFTLLLLTLNKVDLEAFYALEFDFVSKFIAIVQFSSRFTTIFFIMN